MKPELTASEALFLKQLKSHQGRYDSRPIVVAVSGGSDSIGLLRLLHNSIFQFNLRLIIAHLNHGQRGENADADAAFVARLAESLDLTCVVGAWSHRAASSFESAARRARYEWLETVARQHDASLIAVGHTRDDQVETVLHRLVRGTGLRGLSGIPEVRPLAPGLTLVRPLLNQSRQQIQHFLQTIGQTWRDDHTNRDTRQTRARYRHKLLPFLEKHFNPGVGEALVRLARLASDNERVIEEWTAHWLDRHRCDFGPSTIEIPLTPFRSLSPPSRVAMLRALWQAAGWPQQAMSERHWRALGLFADAGTATGSGHFPGVRVRIDRSSDLFLLDFRAADLPGTERD